MLKKPVVTTAATSANSRTAASMPAAPTRGMLPGAADASTFTAFEREREAAGGASHGQQQALGEGLPDEASVCRRRARA